jgi:hypothetical protein
MDSRSEPDSLRVSLQRGPRVQAPASVKGQPAPRAHEGSAGSAQRRRLLYFLNAFDRGGAELGLLFFARNSYFWPFDARVAICRGERIRERRLAASDLSAETLFPSKRMTWRRMATALPRLVGLRRRERTGVLVLSLPQANIVGRIAACRTGVPVVVSFEHNTRLSRRLFELPHLLLSPRVRAVTPALLQAYRTACRTMRAALTRSEEGEPHEDMRAADTICLNELGRASSSFPTGRELRMDSCPASYRPTMVCVLRAQNDGSGIEVP